jgi:hypothetical protein
MNKIDHMLLQSLDDKEAIRKRVEENFTEEQIETIIKNVLDGQINRYLVERTNDIANKKINNIIENELKKLIETEAVLENIQFECKKFIYSNNFMTRISCYFDEQLDGYMGKYVEGYFLQNLTEKFLKDIKDEHDVYCKRNDE